MVESKESTSPKKILLVEEHKVVLRDIIPILQQLGYDVVGSAQDGNDAIELSRKLDVDLILMGIDIPGLINGIDAARIIRSGKNIPIIYLTSSVDSNTINRARDTEPFGYLISPVNLADLKWSIETTLKREALEHGLRNSEERFRLAAEASGNLIYDYDILTGRVEWCGAITALTGMTAEEMALVNYESWMNMIHPDDRESVVSMREKAIDCHTCFNAEYRFLQKDNSYIYIEDDGNFIFNHTKKPRRMVGTLKNTTERQKREKDIHLSEEKFRKAFNNNPALMAILDFETLRFVDVNKTFLDVLEYSSEDVLGKTAPELNLYEEYSLKHDILKSLSTKGFYRGLELRARTKSGQLRDGIFSMDIVDVGDKKLILSVMNDITEKKRIEAEKRRLEEQLQKSQKLESLGRLAGGIAHDFNNILTTITGNVSLAMMDTLENSRTYDNLNDALTGANRATNLIRQLLAFSSKQAVETRIVDANSIIREIERIIRRLIGEDIKIVIDLQDNMGTIKIDPGQLEQILINLCVNSRDAMPHGGTLAIETKKIDIDEAFIATHADAVADSYILISVSDTGVGMTEEIMRNAFEPFYTTKKKDSNAGLGLATVYGIVQQHKGIINLYSKPEKGTTCKIYFPCSSSGLEKTDLKKEDTVWAEGRETIFLVEDEIPVRNIIKEMLVRAGYDVHSFGFPQDALDQITHFDGNIHLLITDVIMPEMDGLQLSKEIGKIRSGIKTLFMSGYSESIITQRGLLPEGVLYISKPFHPHEFLKKVRKILNLC